LALLFLLLLLRQFALTLFERVVGLGQDDLLEVGPGAGPEVDASLPAFAGTRPAGLRGRTAAGCNVEGESLSNRPVRFWSAQ
jgi:hypothetical protein